MKRGNGGLWVKGAGSPNPGGRPKQVLTLLRLARKHSRKALEFAAGLLDNETEEPRVRLEAAKLICSYGLGHPPKYDPRDDAAKPAASAVQSLSKADLEALARQSLSEERDGDEDAPDDDEADETPPH